MNILPKKRWHVRTKENIARVRRDEAEAAEKERQEKLRIENADREARLSLLKNKSKQRLEEAGVVKPNIVHQNEPEPTHINFFSDFEHAVATTNKEHDKEEKEKKEDYEKKIGYLTYLGQDTNEALGKKNWYEVPPTLSRTSEIKDTYDKLVLKDEDGKLKKKELDVKDGEVNFKAKQRLDPIHAFKEYCYGKNMSKVPAMSVSMEKYDNPVMSKQKLKKHKKDKDDKKVKLLRLREARLKREKEEKNRTEMFLKKLNGECVTSVSEDYNKPKIKPKYNSQFNPDLARQNYR